MKRLNVVVSLLFLTLAAVASDYVVTDYGIAPDDTAQLASAAINRAIEACAADGGGRVVVPAGKYRCGTITMQSGVELHLESGALLYASAAAENFPTQPAGSFRSDKDADGWQALLFAADCHDIAVTGTGTIDGRGRGRRDCRPRNVLFISCRDVRVSDIHLRDAASWQQHYLGCEDVIISGIHSYNHCNGNNDGLDIDCCRRVIVENSVIDSDDDAIVLKSTGLVPCEDIVIRGCIASSFTNGIKCGTESIGGFRRILVSDCIIRPSQHTGERFVKTTPTGITALSLELVDGGVMEYITVTGLLIEGTECPVFVRLGARNRRTIAGIPASPRDTVTGTLRHVSISNVQAYSCGNFGCSITGIPGHYVEDVRLTNVHVQSRGGLAEGSYRTPEDLGGTRHDMARDLHLGQYWSDHRQLKEDERGYPQPTVWGNLPCHGLFVRHARDVVLTNCSFTTEQPDPRFTLLAVDAPGLDVGATNLTKKQIRQYP